MADSTVQETLLTRIPAEVLEQISAAPRELYEKVHQRELLLIEQIKHFANIRVEELANYSRNLLKQRQAEEDQEHRRSSHPDLMVPVLKSIVKREPSQMEKRVSFSELPPEVEEFFYSNNGEDDDDDDGGDDDNLYNHDDSDRRYDFKTIDTSSDDEDDRSSHLTPSEEPENSLLLADTAEPVPPSHSPCESPPRLDLTQYKWTPSESEPVISFEDAYGSQESDEEEREAPDFEKEPQQISLSSPQSSPQSPPPVPAGFVGSAPINIGMEALILGQRSSGRINVGKISDTASPKLHEALKPENMSFSQRIAWEDRPV